MDRQDYDFFRQNGYLILGQLFTGQTLTRIIAGFDHDRETWGGNMWRPLTGAYQTVNCDPLVTWPESKRSFAIRKSLCPPKRS